MSGILDHTPAKIIQQLLIQLSAGTDPDDNDAWPVYAPFEPDLPDNCITVQDTTGVETGSDVRTGQIHEAHGIQIRVRANDHDAGFIKANSVYNLINMTDNYQTVVLGSSTYCIESTTSVGPIIDISKIRTDSDRDLFFINALVHIRMTS